MTPQTPPAFIYSTTDDKTVPVANSVMFYSALVKNGVSAEMHLFEHGPHGTGLATQFPALKVWPDLLATWMRTRGLMAAEMLVTSLSSRRQTRRRWMERCLRCGGPDAGIGSARTRLHKKSTPATEVGVHAYLHRVEGDTMNAGYWYRRAGRPVASGEFRREWAAMVETMLGVHAEGLRVEPGQRR